MEGYKTEKMVMPFYMFVLLLSNAVCHSSHAICIKNMGGWKNVWLKKRIIEGLVDLCMRRKLEKKLVLEFIL